VVAVVARKEDQDKKRARRRCGRKKRTSELKVLAPLDRLHAALLAFGALHPQHDLLRRLGLLVEHRLGLAAEAALLPVVPALALREQGRLAGLVLGHLHHLVLLAPLAEGLLGLGDVDLLWGWFCGGVCFFLDRAAAGGSGGGDEGGGRRGGGGGGGRGVIV